MARKKSLVILDAETIGNDLSLSSLEAFGELAVYPSTSPREIVSRCGNSQMVITNKVCFGEEEFTRLPDLQLLCLTATGFNNIDLEAARRHGKAVVNVSGYSTEAVTQHTFAMLFYLLEQLRRQDDFVRSGEWSASGIFTWLGLSWRELSRLKWGIIGLGNIGKRVAEVATAFGCEVVYFSTSGRNLDGGWPHRTLPELLGESDIVSIHAPLNGTTRGLIGAEELSMMREGSILLNLGRGGIIDETALASALKKGRPAAAGLDVLEKEPPDINSPLMRYDAEENRGNLLVTPHSAWAPRDTRQRVIKETAANISAFIQGNRRNRLD